MKYLIIFSFLFAATQSHAGLCRVSYVWEEDQCIEICGSKKTPVEDELKCGEKPAKTEPSDEFEE